MPFSLVTDGFGLPLSLIPAMIVFLFPLAYSPGPGNLFFAAIGARYGVGAAWSASAGYHVATVVLTAAVGLALLMGSEVGGRALAWLQPLGAAYVLWLAWRLFHAPPVAADGMSAPPVAGFRSGALLLLLNPKAYAIIALLYSQFLLPEAGWPWVIAVAVLFTLNNFIAFTVWTVAGDRLLSRFREGVSATRLNRGLAAILAAVGLWLLIG